LLYTRRKGASELTGVKPVFLATKRTGRRQLNRCVQSLVSVMIHGDTPVFNNVEMIAVKDPVRFRTDKTEFHLFILLGRLFVF
jgi:hypothetical protein